MHRHRGAAAPLDRAAIERRLGLDLPIHVQYGRWIGGILLRGTLGESLPGGWRIEERILGRLPVTTELGLLAILIGLAIALPVGIYSAMRQYTAADYVGRSVAIMGLATPNFWLGTMVMIYPAIWWTWSPPMGFFPLSEDPLGNLGMFLMFGDAVRDLLDPRLRGRLGRYGAAKGHLTPTDTPGHRGVTVVVGLRFLASATWRLPCQIG